MRCLSILFIMFISSQIWFGDMARVKSHFLKTFPTATLCFRQTHILNAQRTIVSQPSEVKENILNTFEII